MVAARAKHLGGDITDAGSYALDAKGRLHPAEIPPPLPAFSRPSGVPTPHRTTSGAGRPSGIGPILMPDDRGEWGDLADLAARVQQTDPSLVAFLSRRSRFRHTRTAVVALYVIAPAFILAGTLAQVSALLVVGLCLVPITAVLTPLVLRAPRGRTQPAQPKEHRNGAAS
jgi:hypothetical protein